MPHTLELRVDTFTFSVATDRRYTKDGLWVRPEAENRVRVGLADYVQQHSGDITFASVKPAGTGLAVGDAFAEIETIKTMLDLASPVSGTVVEANPSIEPTPELINQDPFGKGWLVLIEPADWEADRATLLEPDAYLSAMQSQVQAERKQS